MPQRDLEAESEWRDERPVAEQEGPRTEPERDLSGLEEPGAKDWVDEEEAVRQWVPEPRLEAGQ